MGSTGYGTFGNYRPGGIGGGGGAGLGGGAGIGGVAGGGAEQSCPKEVVNIKLEDVATSEYYQKRSAVPSAGAKVRLRSELHCGRLVVELEETGEILGNMPTQYHSLLLCMKKGLHYTGEVSSSGLQPIPFIIIHLYA